MRATGGKNRLTHDLQVRVLGKASSRSSRFEHLHSGSAPGAGENPDHRSGRQRTWERLIVDRVLAAIDGDHHHPQFGGGRTATVAKHTRATVRALH